MKTSSPILFAVLFLALSLFTITKVAGHCDTLDGPVVETAKLALQKGDVTPVLKWVNKESEKEIREAFASTIKVRSQGEDARKLADMHFFETLVRVHRAGEGEPFTGLKPPGTIDPAFQAADKALREGAVDELAAEIAKSVQDGIRKRFAEVIEKKKHADDSTEAGRAYVAAYIEYAHFVEAIHTIASGGAGEHHHLHTTDDHNKQNSADPQPSNAVGSPVESFEASGVEPVFPEKDQAINYAQNRACFRSGEIRIFDSRGNVERIIPFNETERKL